MNAEFSRTLALLRQEKGVSQRTAADALGISQALMSHYEKGVREPGLAFLVRACEYYGVSADYLLGRTLTRDGSSIQADELYDLSEDKGNVLKGYVLASLSKKIMVNSVGMLYDLLGATGNREVVKTASNYLGTAIAVIFRRIHSNAPRTNPSFFAVSQQRFLCGAYDMELKGCEMEMMEVLANHKKNHGDFPDLNHDALTEKYGPLYQSLLQNLYGNGKRVNDLLSGREEEKPKSKEKKATASGATSRAKITVSGGSSPAGGGSGAVSATNSAQMSGNSGNAGVNSANMGGTPTETGTSSGNLGHSGGNPGTGVSNFGNSGGNTVNTGPVENGGNPVETEKSQGNYGAWGRPLSEINPPKDEE